MKLYSPHMVEVKKKKREVHIMTSENDIKFLQLSIAITHIG
jgi:hypothetical protein